MKKVKVVIASGLEYCFSGKKVVLCAGTLDSPALLLRSGIEIQSHGAPGRAKIKAKEGKAEEVRGDKEREPAVRVPKFTGVTDHNIYGFRFTIKGGDAIESAKLQLEGEVSTCVEGEAKIPFLLNICINANSFLARGWEQDKGREVEGKGGVCTLTYEFRAPINSNNYVALDVFTGQPILHIKNSGEETV